MQSNSVRITNTDWIQELVQFCIHEIALQGLEGCKLTYLFELFLNSASVWQNSHESNTCLTQIYNFLSIINNLKEKKSGENNYEVEFLWKLLVHQNDIDFYDLKIGEKSTKKSEKVSMIINDGVNRGYCINYFERRNVNKMINGCRNEILSYESSLNEFGGNLIIVANQDQRNNIICPSHKFLDFENINDIEYCVLEAIARSRYNGSYTAGEDGLAKKFNLSSKQLHYSLIMLEGHDLIKKQVLKSEKMRSIIYLKRYAFKNKTLVENVSEFLMCKGQSKEAEFNYADTFVNIKKKFLFTNKQFKTLVHNGERLGVFKRFMTSLRIEVNSNGKKSFKLRETRMLKLSESQIDLMKKISICPPVNELNETCESEVEQDDNDGDLDYMGIQQLNTMPLYTQILTRIEQSGKEGISLKKLGNIFGFDFYKARRLGTNLQTHPEIVTIMKETHGGRAKFQTLVMRKLLKLNIKSSPKVLNSIESSISNEISNEVKSIDSNEKVIEPELVIIKRDNQSTKTIQALMSDRSVTRKKIVLNYLEKHKICTKYEIDKEIRTIEAENGLKGCIDSKTTKRMLFALEKENKLKTFTVNLKNISYMGVRLSEISEADEFYLNYCSTFKRTFDTVELKINRNHSVSNEILSNTKDKDSEVSNEKNDSYQNYFQLTRQFINNVVSNLDFSTSNCKAYALVPKFQKAIVLHRFLQYLLFFYDGKRQEKTYQIENSTREGSNLFEEIGELESNIVNSCEIPTVDKTFQPIEQGKEIPWNAFIPPLNRVSKINALDANCVFIGEIFSHMPVSIFCSLIAINHYVPGLVCLLKHPEKRHILVKDLPPELIAPLIFERRYLRRIFSILHILACLGLVTFVNSPCNTNQAINRDAQSQMIYVHRKAMFLDTSINKATTWNELKEVNDYNFKHIHEESKENKDVEPNGLIKYEKCFYDFKNQDQVIQYWRRLLHVSMNNFKFNVQSYLHENKRMRQEHLNSILLKNNLTEIDDLWSIEKYGDQMGPGGYSSQLFLNTFKNWVLSTNFSSNPLQSTNKLLEKKNSDLYRAPYSELTLSLPFGIFRNNLSANSGTRLRSRKRKTVKNKNDTDNDDVSDVYDTSPKKKIKRSMFEKPLQLDKKKTESIKADNEKQKTFKYIKAKTLIDRARNFMSTKKMNPNCLNLNLDRRAIWQADEDELILLIKVASLYFLPNEKSVPFKLISDLMNELVPEKCYDKKLSSFGRRIKILMKSDMNVLFVSNKLELCKQSSKIRNKFRHAKLAKSVVNKEVIELYLNFVKDIKEEFLDHKDYSKISIENEMEPILELPDTMEEFKKKFTIKNTPKDQYLDNQIYFQQPISDYDITFNTLHSAIHSSILINDKNPRVYESFNLFDKYSDQLLTDVIAKMSRDHRIIAPTKCSELKKKNVTSFSKHIGKAYHISQRYQYKWINNISSSVLTETNVFKEKLNSHKLELRKNEDEDGMFDCTDHDDVGTTSFLAHTIENSDVQLQIDVPNKIWVSKLI